MQLLPVGRLAPGLVAGLAVTLVAPAGRAQQPPKAERVKFLTADKAELQGTFYPSIRGTKGATVLLLHEFGGNTQQGNWDQLAKELQKSEHAVLTFDLRGHGDSSNVVPEFWNFPHNRGLLRGFNPANPKQKISFKDFPTVYQKILVNDVAAAKRFLDQQNDARSCNSGNLILIGAETGATLGGIWMATEWGRRRLVPGAIGVAANQGYEGQDIAAAVWLSISSTLGNQQIPWTRLWGQSPIRDKVPMCFFYGDGDTRAANIAKNLYDNVLKAERANAKLKLTFKTPIKGTKMSGKDLLKDSLDTQKLILKYLDEVLKERIPNAWQNREVDKTPFVVVPLQQFGIL